MIKIIFISGIIIVSGIANSATAQQSDSNISSDSTAVFQHWVESLPDSIKVSVPADSLKSIFLNCFDDRFNMPIFKPDPKLTDNMPQLMPPKVDEKMIVPQFKNCPEKTGPPQK